MKCGSCKRDEGTLRIGGKRGGISLKFSRKRKGDQNRNGSKQTKTRVAGGGRESRDFMLQETGAPKSLAKHCGGGCSHDLPAGTASHRRRITCWKRTHESMGEKRQQMGSE